MEKASASGISVLSEDDNVASSNCNCIELENALTVELPTNHRVVFTYTLAPVAYAVVFITDPPIVSVAGARLAMSVAFSTLIRDELARVLTVELPIESSD